MSTPHPTSSIPTPAPSLTGIEKTGDAIMETDEAVGNLSITGVSIQITEMIDLY
jgi:hypothetical protein